MVEISFNTQATVDLLKQRFHPETIHLKRLQGLTKLPDILVVSDLDGSKWGRFTDGIRSNYHTEQNLRNAEAFNCYSDRFIVADVTGQDVRMTRHLLDVYRNFDLLDFLANDSGLDLRVNELSLAPHEFLYSLNEAEAYNPYEHWDRFINSFFDKQKFYELMQVVLADNGFQEILLNDKDRLSYIYPNCHRLYRSSEYPYIDVSISPGEMSLVTIETRKNYVLDEADFLVRDLCNKLQEQIATSLSGQEAERVMYQVGLGENFGYAFFTHADDDKQISKATIPFAILQILPDDVLNELKAVICIGDGANDRHLGLTEINYQEKNIPVYRIVSGESLYKKNPVWLKRDAGRLELAPELGDIAEALHQVVQQIDLGNNIIR